MFDPDAIVLRIYRAPTGQWGGCLSAGREEVGRVSGCDSPRAVEQAVRDTGITSSSRFPHAERIIPPAGRRPDR